MDLDGAIVSEEFRGKVLKAFPVLKSHPNPKERVEWFRFFDLLCFGCFVDSTSVRPRKVVPHLTILKAIGRESTTTSSEFKSGEFIAKFTEYVLPRLLVSAYDPRGKARELIDDGLRSLRADIDHELLNFHSVPTSKKVHLVTGERWTPPKVRKLREEDRRIAESEIPKVAAAQKIVCYLNSLKGNLFTSRVGANMDSAIKAAIAIADKRHQRIELSKLHRIAIQPQPFYGPPTDAHTVRVFAKNISIQSLKNEIKSALIEGWTTFDLKAAQFAIVAKDWEMTELHTWLSAPGNDIWKVLCELYSDIPPSIIKPTLKPAVYSICYGMDREKVVSELTDRFIDLGHSDSDSSIRANAFVTDAYVIPLFKHRDLMQEKIKRERGAKDCFGQWIACSKEVRPHRILAQLSQAREMQLLLPALELAKKRSAEFKIVLWEHDGFSVHFTRKDRIESESQRIMDAVNAECGRLGYPTRLERK